VEADGEERVRDCGGRRNHVKGFRCCCERSAEAKAKLGAFSRAFPSASPLVLIDVLSNT
jgi:hypothetical protein